MPGPPLTSCIQSNVTLVDVVSTRMLGQFGFLARVFEVFKRNRWVGGLEIELAECCVCSWTWCMDCAGSA